MCSLALLLIVLGIGMAPTRRLTAFGGFGGILAVGGVEFGGSEDVVGWFGGGGHGVLMFIL